MPRILPMGERALLVEAASLDAVLALHAALERSRPQGVIDLVPAARTVLVRIDPRVLPLAAARAWVAAIEPEQATARAEREVVLDVAYDGPDLAETAELLGIGPGVLTERHLRAAWRVAFTGFAPGFAYLVSSDWTFDVPRLAVPRTRVPAGAVGLAAGFTGAYPRETPGGWRLIGTTGAPLFDPDAASPALLAPGMSVRLRAVDAAAPPPRTSRPPAHDGAVRLDEPGLLATLQDLGRPGSASLGVSTSGAVDRTALRAANRLVGNHEGAAALEVTLGGLRATAQRPLWFAVTGAWGPVTLDGHPIDPYEAHAWPTGAQLHVDWFSHGSRAYLAVRGGFDARTVLGSRATDLLAGLGPAPVQAGEFLAVAGDTAGPVPIAAPVTWSPPHDDALDLDLAPGPRADWFAPTALTTLFEAVWTVSHAADRVGVRLDGPPLERSRHDELPSEGMVPGALQVPPSGLPTILGVDGPVTGGYPVIAVATEASLDRLAQARPGTRIRFRHARAG